MKKLYLLILFALFLTVGCKKTSSGPKTFKITSSVDGAGTISPLGTAVVKAGVDQTYTFTSSDGSAMTSVTVDGASRPIANSFTFFAVEDDHTINVSFGLIVKSIAGANGTAATPVTIVHSGGSITVGFIPNASFHTDSLFLDGTFVKLLAGATTYTLTNITATHTIRVTFSDALPQHSLDSLKNLLVGSWHYVQYDYQYDGTTKWIIAPYLTDCEKARHEVYTADNRYTYFLGGTSCDPTYAPTNIYLDGTWKFNASAKQILIAGNEYTNATDHEYVTGSYTVEKLTLDSLVISYPEPGKGFSYRFHYTNK